METKFLRPDPSPLLLCAFSLLSPTRFSNLPSLPVSLFEYKFPSAATFVTYAQSFHTLGLQGDCDHEDIERWGLVPFSIGCLLLWSFAMVSLVAVVRQSNLLRSLQAPQEARLPRAQNRLVKTSRLIVQLLLNLRLQLRPKSPTVQQIVLSLTMSLGGCIGVR